MGLYDNILDKHRENAVLIEAENQKGLYDDILAHPRINPPAEAIPDVQASEHPFLSSLPEAGKQFGLRAVKSYPEFAKGLNDLTALAGDTMNIKGLSDFGKKGAQGN